MTDTPPQRIALQPEDLDTIRQREKAYIDSLSQRYPHIQLTNEQFETLVKGRRVEIMLEIHDERMRQSELGTTQPGANLVIASNPEESQTTAASELTEE